MKSLRVRRLGRVPYREALDLQHVLFDLRVRGGGEDYMLLLEHPPTYTRGRRTDPANLLVSDAEYARLGADIVDADRGGDVTFHGPGQLVAYPVLRLGARADVVAHVRSLEEIVIRTLADFGIAGGRIEGWSGVWTDRGKVAAVGCRITRGVTMHGIALNVSTDLSWFDHIVPCGIPKPVTSMGEMGPVGAPGMDGVADAFVRHAGEVFGREPVEAGTLWAAPGPRRRAVVAAGPDVRAQARDRPPWLKRRARLADPGYRELKGLLGRLDLHTVCEEAGCPNIYECWGERTATLMILGDTCTRACGFCEVHSGRPPGLDREEPERAAAAVDALGIEHAVVTSVARDDLPDGGAAVFAATIAAIHRRRPTCTVEVLVPDFKGDAGAAGVVFAARPDVFNHNLETVVRLQRLVRPQAGYARSLTLLARAKAAGLATKSGLICGLGETGDEILAAAADLAAVGVDILTLGQYLRPTGDHVPVDRWVSPAEFERLGAAPRALGLAPLEAGPLVRSSYHARDGAAAVSEGGRP